MPAYTDAEFRAICDAIWKKQSYETRHSTLFAEVAAFVQKASGLTLSYAMSHPWLSPPKDSEADTQQIMSAKKLAYLLCPARPRLRLVDLDTEGDIDASAAIANLKHYNGLLPDFPMIFGCRERSTNRHTDLKVSGRRGCQTHLRRNEHLSS